MSTQASLESVALGPSVLPARADDPKVRIYRHLSDLPDYYAPLFDENGARSFFHNKLWFENLANTALDPGDEVRVYGLELEDSCRVPVAALMMRFSANPSKGLPPRTLTSLSNYYTPHYGPLLRGSCDAQAALDTLAQAIGKESPSWDAVRLDWLDRDSPAFSALARAFSSAGMVVQTYFCAGNWYLPTRGRSYNEYFESLKSSVRNIAKSKNKKIERSDRVRVEILTGQENLESRIEAYGRIYASSWKVPEPYSSFIPDLIRTCAKLGCLRLGLAYVDSEPAAAQLWIVSNGIASIYKIAYDKRFADLSVGTYLTTELMKRVMDVDNVREVDYLTGDDAYKSDWMSHRRECWGILALNPRTFHGALGIVRHVGGRAVKRGLLSLTRRWHRRRPEKIS